MVTIQAVEVTPDYAHAKVFFSVLTGDPVETAQGLNAAAGFLRSGLFNACIFTRCRHCTSFMTGRQSVLPT